MRFAHCVVAAVLGFVSAAHADILASNATTFSTAGSTIGNSTGNGGYNEEFAMHFTVPAGAVWSIDSLSIPLKAGSTSTAPFTINADASGFPGVVLYNFTFTNIPAAASLQTAAGTPGVTLLPGTYWIASAIASTPPTYANETATWTVIVPNGGFTSVATKDYSGPTASSTGWFNQPLFALGYQVNGTAILTPEPASAGLLALGAASFVLRKRRSR